MAKLDSLKPSSLYPPILSNLLHMDELAKGFDYNIAIPKNYVIEFLEIMSCPYITTGSHQGAVRYNSDMHSFSPSFL